MDIFIDVNNIKVETPRLILRAHCQDDLQDMFEYASVEGVGIMAAWNRHENLEQSQTMLDNFITNKKVFAIELKENSKNIGYLGLYTSWAEKNADYCHLNMKEIVYVLSKNYWGKGIMPEAVNAVIEYCFNTLNLDALTCGHFVINEKSKRVIEKSGFKFINTSIYHAKQLGKDFENANYILMNNNN